MSNTKTPTQAKTPPVLIQPASGGGKVTIRAIIRISGEHFSSRSPRTEGDAAFINEAALTIAEEAK